MKILIVLVVIVLIVVVLLRRRSPDSAPGKTVAPTRRRAGKTPPKPTSPYRSTSIKCGPGACEAALALQGRRMLIEQVPRLPLADCTAEKCECKYSHHEDRREPRGDRRTIAGLGTELYAQTGKEERRGESQATGRRDSDSPE